MDKLGAGWYVAFVAFALATAFLGGYLAGWSDATNPDAAALRQKAREARSRYQQVRSNS